VAVPSPETETLPAPTVGRAASSFSMVKAKLKLYEIEAVVEPSKERV
jgi:hypothetical protein